jgi:hypothetical protein
MKNYKPLPQDELVKLDNEYQKLIWGKPSTLYPKDAKVWKDFKEWITYKKLPLPCEKFMNEDTRVGYRILSCCHW